MWSSVDFGSMTFRLTPTDLRASPVSFVHSWMMSELWSPIHQTVLPLAALGSNAGGATNWGDARAAVTSDFASATPPVAAAASVPAAAVLASVATAAAVSPAAAAGASGVVGAAAGGQQRGAGRQQRGGGPPGARAQGMDGVSFVVGVVSEVVVDDARSAAVAAASTAPAASRATR